MIKKITGGVCAPQGFLASGVHCGIRKNKNKRDLALIYSESVCTAASVYTQNKVKGAPIYVTKRNLADGRAKAVICNSGNANTGNADGVEIAEKMCEALGTALSISPCDVIVASTGVIGQPLPLEPIVSGIAPLVQALSDDGSQMAAEAIMTTDQVMKETAYEFLLDGVTCRIGAISKGSGMIHPNMATLLAFVTTDAAITAEMLQKALNLVVKDTFNMISIDGDTSTNDMLSILANGKAGNRIIDQPGEAFDCFTSVLMTACVYLARVMASDGEGATKLLECTVCGAADVDTAKAVAKSVITSSLFKAMMFAGDANWGRILCAIGYTDREFDIDKVAVTLASAKGSFVVYENGGGAAFSEERAKEILSEKEIQILVNLGGGDQQATAWGCDLTYDYVKINGDYRT